MRQTIRITSILAVLCVAAGLFAGVTISDVEYLAGEDFVQLHFKTGKMIPIPDLYYPESGNYTRIVMRIPDAAPAAAAGNLQFDSAVIDSVQMSREGNDTQVEIRLKQRLNYRVFTNTRGLFIEFPQPQTTPAAVRPERPAAETPAVSDAVPVAAADEVVLKSFRVAEKDPESLRFAFQLSDEVQYKVIPIPEPPARLAIDLFNVRARSLARDVDHLNVKRLRGAYNRPGVFRLVFDLEAMKDYSVTYDKGRLNVAFFDSRRLPAPRPVIAEARMARKQQAEAPAEAPGQTVADAAAQPAAEAARPAPPIRLEIHGDQAVTTEPVSRADEFFGNEKADVAALPPAQPQTDPALPPDEAAVSGQTQYLRKTIESGRKEYTGQPMNFIFKDADLKNVLKAIAGMVGVNLVMDPGVTGRVTSELIGVPWDQALEIFLKINGLDMVLEGNILRVGRIDVLAREAQNRRKLKEAKVEEEDLEVFTRQLSYAKANEILKILNPQLTPRGSILVDDRTNTMIISEVPGRIQLLDRLIDTLDEATPQVSIEARIIESNVNAAEAFGVQWGYNMVADAAYGNQTSLSFPNSIQIGGNQISNIQNPGLIGPLGGYAINLPAQGRTSGTVFSFGNVANTFRLDMAISALQRKGKVKIISSPRTTTQNNMEATITQGRQIPVQTIQNNTVTVRFQPAALELKVTPQITARGDVICTLDIQNNAADFANLVNGIPPIITQSTATTIRVPDGQTIAIGGLYRVENAVTREGVPLLSKIPILGSLFRNRSVSGDKRELLIFVTPRIIK